MDHDLVETVEPDISDHVDPFAIEGQRSFAGIRIAACALMVGTMVKMWKSGVRDPLGGVIFAVVFLLSVFTEVSTVWLVLAALLTGILSFHNSREAKP